MTEANRQADADPQRAPEGDAPGDEAAGAQAAGADSPEQPDEPEQEPHPPVIAVEDAGPARKRIRIEVPPERISAKVEENFQSLREEATLPGFRRGRAPRRLLEKRFGGDVRQEVCNQFVGETYQQAVEEHELRVLGEPNIKDQDNLSLPEEGPLAFEVEVEVAPEVELPDLKGIEIKRPVREVSDKDIDAEIERAREMYGRVQPAEESAAGDFATGEVKVFNEAGELVEDHPEAQFLIPGKSRKFKGVIAGILVDDLGKRLAGKKPGDAVTIEATGPSGHENEALRDKPLRIEARLKAIQRHTPLEPAELIEAAGVENEQELRESLREQLGQRNEIAQRRAMAAQVADLLLGRIEVELPPDLSARQAQQVLQRRAMEMMYQGATQQEIEEHLAELRAGSEQQAQRELRLMFIFDAIAREHDIEVSEAEVNGRIVSMAIQQGVRPEKQREEMARTGQLDQLHVQIREGKAIDRVLEEANVVDVPFEEWEKAERERREATEAAAEAEAEAEDEATAQPEAASEPEDPAAKTADADQKPKKKKSKKKKKKKAK